MYPDNYVKLRFLENHDQTRARFLIPDVRALRNWTAFNFFQKGLALVYAGQEYAVSHLPSLFDKDTVDWFNIRNEDLTSLMTKLAAIKKDALFADSTYHVEAQGEDFLIATHEKDGRKALGVFAVTGKTALVKVDFPDGVYSNRIDGRPVEVFRGRIASHGVPIILM